MLIGDCCFWCNIYAFCSNRPWLPNTIHQHYPQQSTIQPHTRVRWPHQFSRPHNHEKKHAHRNRCIQEADNHRYHHTLHIHPPHWHKLAAYRYHITRMLSLPLKTTQQQREWETILHIAQQNGFPTAMIHKLRHQIEHKTKHTSPQDRKNKKWATFTYISPQICKITNLFRNTNIRITYKCRNTIANRIKPPGDHTPPHNQCGIYQLTCNTCNLL